MLSDTDLIYTEVMERESNYPVFGSPKSVAQHLAGITQQELPSFVEAVVRDSYKWGFNRAEAGCKN